MTVNPNLNAEYSLNIIITGGIALVLPNCNRRTSHYSEYSIVKGYNLGRRSFRKRTIEYFDLNSNLKIQKLFAYIIVNFVKITKPSLLRI